jgi:hypothetical protein
MNVVGYVGRLKGRSMGGSKTTQPIAGQWECESAKEGPCKGKRFMSQEEHGRVETAVIGKQDPALI